MTEKLSKNQARQGREDGTGKRLLLGSGLMLILVAAGLFAVGPETIAAYFSG